MSTRDPAALSLRGIDKAFDGAVVLRDVHLDVAPGEVLALLGPSGCGKTTALRIVAGLEAPDRGTVAIAGVEMSSSSRVVPPERRRVGMVFQHGALFPHLDVTRNVGFGLERGSRRGGERVDEVLELVGLEGFGEREPTTLSGGQAQRVALARALAPDPAVLLLDEPFSNLDAVLRHRLRRDVRRVIRAAGTTTVFVTHDRDEAFAVADRVAVMRGGRIVQIGSPHDVYASPIDAEVAVFVGEANLIPVSGAEGPEVHTPWGRRAAAGPGAAEGGVWVVRPEALRCVDPATAAGSDSRGPTVAGRVREVELYGSTTVSVVAVSAASVSAASVSAAAAGSTDAPVDLLVSVRELGVQPRRPGEEVVVACDGGPAWIVPTAAHPTDSAERTGTT